MEKRRGRSLGAADSSQASGVALAAARKSDSTSASVRDSERQ